LAQAIFAAREQAEVALRKEYERKNDDSKARIATLEKELDAARAELSINGGLACMNLNDSQFSMDPNRTEKANQERMMQDLKDQLYLTQQTLFKYQTENEQLRKAAAMRQEMYAHHDPEVLFSFYASLALLVLTICVCCRFNRTATGNGKDFTGTKAAAVSVTAARSCTCCSK
jgi:hypothetical protein